MISSTNNVLTIPYSDDLLITSGQTRERLEEELRFLLSVKLFEIRRVSLGKAAELCNMSTVAFMDALGQMGIATINLESDQIADELK